MAPPVSAEVNVPEVTKPVSSMDAEDSHVSSGGAPSMPEVEVTPAECPQRPSFYGRGAWGQLPKHVSPVSELGGAAGGLASAVEAHRVEPCSAVGDSPSSQTLSSAAPSSCSGDGALEGGVTSISVPDGGPCLSVSDDSSAASNVFNSEGYLICDVDNAVSNANNVDNAICKVSNGRAISNVSNGSAISKVSNGSAICNVSSVDNAVNVNNVDYETSNTNISAGNAGACCSVDSEPKSRSSATLISDVSPGLGESVPDVSVEVSPSPSEDAEMVPASGPRKWPAPESPMEDSVALPGLASCSVSKEPGKSKVSKKPPRPPGHHSLPRSMSLAARKASSQGPPS